MHLLETAVKTEESIPTEEIVDEVVAKADEPEVEVVEEVVAKADEPKVEVVEEVVKTPEIVEAKAEGTQ